METVRRGYEPRDAAEFGPQAANAAAQELAFLLDWVVTTDAIILDKCGGRYNLNRGLIAREVPDAWIFRARV